MTTTKRFWDLVVNVNRGSVEQTRKSIQDIEDSFDSLVLTQGRVGKTADDIAASIKAMESTSVLSVNELQQALEKVRLEGGRVDDVIGEAARTLQRFGQTSTQDVQDLAKALGLSASEATRLTSILNKTPGKTPPGTPPVRPEYSGPNLSTGLSAVRGVPGLEGVAGLEAAEGLISLVEELPNLRDALSQLPTNIKSVTQAIGLKGAGWIGGMGLALIALTALVQRNKQFVETSRAVLSAQGEYFNIINTQTQEQIEGARLEAAAKKRALEEQLENLKTQQAEFRQAIIDEFGLVASQVNEFNASVGTGGAELIAFRDEIAATEKALAGTGVELKNYNRALEDQSFLAKEAARAEAELAAVRLSQLDEELKRNLELKQLLETGSTESIRTLLSDLATERDFILDTALKLNEEGLAGIEGGAEALGAYLSRVGEIDERTRQLTETILPLVDAREREEEQAARLLQVQAEQAAGFDQRLSAELNYLQQSKDITIEGVTQRLQAIEDEKRAIQTLLPELERLAPESEAAANKLIEFETRLRRLGVEAGQVADRLGSGAISRARRNLSNEISQLTSQFRDDSTNLRAEYNQTILGLMQDRDQKIQEAEQKSAEDRQKAEVDFREGLIKSEENLNKERLKITQNFNKSYQSALADRDAVAAFQAKVEKEASLQQAEQQAAAEEIELRKKYSQQLQIIRNQLSSQTNTIRQNFQQQSRDAFNKYQSDLNSLRNALSAEISSKRNAYQRQLQDLQKFTATGSGMVNTFAQTALAALARLVNSAKSLSKGSYSTSSGITKPTNTQIPISVGSGSSGGSLISQQFGPSFDAGSTFSGRTQQTYSNTSGGRVAPNIALAINAVNQSSILRGVVSALGPALESLGIR